MRKLSKSQIDVAHESAMLEMVSHAREGMIPFTKATKSDYEVNWHHRVLGRHLDLFVAKKIKRLMVFMPPRNGKSELTSRRLPAFIFGRNPDAQIIGTSYGADLSSRLNRDVQRIMESEAYGRVFPSSSLGKKNIRTVASGSWLRNSDIFEIVGRRGVYRSAGVGGAITGQGAEYLLIDDPIKNQEEADSEVYRERVWDWYTSTAFTRLEKDGCVLLTMTRWHEDDLGGRLLRAQPGEWTVLSFPAVKEDDLNHLDQRQIGEPLWANKYDTKALESIKRSVGSRVWNSLYQQRPAPDKGAVVNRDWWRFYKEMPADFDMIIQSWDLTFHEGKKNDFVVGQVWGRVGAQKYLLDQFRERIGFTGTLSAFTTLSAKWEHSAAKLVEDAANGAALVDTLRKRISGILAIKPRGKKLVRAQAVSPQIEAGNVFLPDPSIAPWIHDYIEEWAMFPNGTHDDQVDSTSQALSYLATTEFIDMDIVSIQGESYWNL